MMVRRFNILSLILSLLLLCNVAVGQDVHVQFETALETKNIKSFSKLFDHRVEISIDGEVNSYSQQQAQVVLSEFLSQFKTPNFELLHSGTSKTQSKYYIGKLTAENEVYRVYLFLKKVNGTDYIQEIKFEKH